MKLSDMSISQQIRHHYAGEDGIWIVAKGKVKECKLLKEAAQELDRQRHEIERLWEENRDLKRDKNVFNQELLKPYQEETSKAHRRIRELTEKLKTIKWSVKNWALENFE